MLEPISRRSLSDAVYAQLRDRITRGLLAPGEALPSERVLVEELGVNRGAVREALRRLEQARLITVRHGGTSRVQDFRRSAGLGLLVELALSSDGEPDPHVVRSILEMRAALGPDVARHAAVRRTDAQIARLREALGRMEAPGRKLEERQRASLDFWSELVDAADNLAYRLAYNSLREVTEAFLDRIAPLMREELEATGRLHELVEAVATGDPGRAEDGARAALEPTQARIGDALSALVPDGDAS